MTLPPISRRASVSKRPIRRSHKASFEQLPKLANLSLAEGSRGRDSERSGQAHGDHTHAHSRLHNAVSTWLKDERTKWQSRTDPHRRLSTHILVDLLIAQFLQTSRMLKWLSRAWKRFCRTMQLSNISGHYFLARNVVLHLGD